MRRLAKPIPRSYLDDLDLSLRAPLAISATAAAIATGFFGRRLTFGMKLLRFVAS